VSDERQLPLRLAALGAVAVIFQITAVSQVTLLGVSADVSPLVVASVGLLAGAMPGAIMGFAMGLFVDLALAQTLGISSILLLIVGYGAGRLRELRDPGHGLVPLGVGIAASLTAVGGFSVFQFLLGVDAPVSFLLVRQVLAITVVGALLALPVYAIVRRVVRPSLPDDPRRRRRRTYTTGGLSPLSRPSVRP